MTFALVAARDGRVALLTKRELDESNTNFAQGGVAAVWDPEDTTASHAADTIEAGAGLCNRRVVDLVVEEGPARIRDLIETGVKFSLKKDNGRLGADYDLGLEGGHTHRRILHAADHTGQEIVC